MSPNAVKFAVAAFWTVLYSHSAFAADNSLNSVGTASIATLRELSESGGPLHPNVQVNDYYGVGNGCPIQYAWNATDNRPDDGGAVINPTGNNGIGRWNLALPANSPLHTCVYGVRVDSRASTGIGTDNTTQLQNALNWAYNYGPNRVHLDSLQGYCIKIASIIHPNQGETMEGDGPGNTNSINSRGVARNTGSCLNYTGIPGSNGAYVLTTQSILTGYGTAPFEAPKFRNFSINYFSTDTNPGGCIQVNSIAGGFTDTPGSQQYMVRPEFENIFCNMRLLAGSHKIGIQVSKGIDGFARNVSVFGGLNGFDIEGSENFQINGGSVSYTYGSDVILNRQGTFGQVNSVQNIQLLSPAGLSQTVDSLIYDNARSSIIQNVFTEDVTTNTLNCQIHLVSGFTAGVYGNALTAPAKNWLCVDAPYNNITAYGNGSYGVGISEAKFSAGNSLYSDGVPQVLSHFGNGVNGDSGWPFNSQMGLDQAFPPKVEAIWSPDYNGLTPNGWGLREVPVNSTYTLPTIGSNNFLQWTYNHLPAPTGTFDLSIHAWQTSGTGQITCQLTDNGSPVGRAISLNIKAAPAWYTLGFAEAISTGAGVECWNSGIGTGRNPAMFNLVQLQDH
jgi:hypothetical protein